MVEYQYLSVDQVIESSKYPFSRGQIRFFLSNRDKNGLSNAVRKIGKRVYFRDDLLQQWVESQTVEVL